VPEHDLAVVVLDVIVEANAVASLGQHAGESRLAHLKRLAPQVVTFKLDQVEGIQEDVRVVAPVTEPVK
jgi:hypothetical protein